MSKALSLKMDERIFKETEKVIKKIRIPRNAYINQAVDFYNRLQKRKSIQKQLIHEAQLLKKDTVDYLSSYELLEDFIE